MQARLIREAELLIRDRSKTTGKTTLRVEKVSAGHVVQGQRAWLLCLQGLAVPFDKECRDRVQMTDAEIENAVLLYDKIKLGITKEDEKAYDSGLMRGYLDGKWIPGPSHYEGAEDEYYDDEDEDDDE